MRRTSRLSALFLLSLWSCGTTSNEKLPILGETTVDKETGEIIHYQTPSFSFRDQLNKTITSKDLDGKIYLVDFFFTSCPTICPQMTTHLLDVQNHFKKDDRVAIVSFSIDPEHDTPDRLREYANNYGIDQNKWSLLTGKESDVFEIARGFKVRAFDDSTPEESNLIHDGTFVLIDDQQRIRGYYNGLEKSDVDRLIRDVELLLDTY